jgi:cleavage and polyadenylation specificity factor subunit 4
MADDDDLAFDFEASLAPADEPEPEAAPPPDVTAEEVGQQPANFIKNYRQTVCTYWLRGLCMKGDSCGFLHKFDPQKMPVCRSLIKTGRCDDLDCPYKHSLDDVKECNMYKLGLCIYGPTCRYKHTKQPGALCAVCCVLCVYTGAFLLNTSWGFERTPIPKLTPHSETHSTNPLSILTTKQQNN